MPGTAFGFGPYPPRPSVPPRAIGQALMLQSLQGQLQPAPQSATQSLQDAPGLDPRLQSLLGLTPAPAGPAPGSVYEGGMGPDGGEVGDFISFEDRQATTGMRPAMAVPAPRPDATAVGRALGAPTGQQGSPPAPFSDEQLRRLGLPEMELRLLRTTGALR